MSKRTVGQWRREVYRSPLISDATRVLLLLMADLMDAGRRISVPRKELAEQLGRHEQRVAERIASGHQAGLLDTVSPGYRGHTAVYIGLFPDRSTAGKRTDLEYAKGPRQRYALAGYCVPDGEYTTTRADPSERGTDPDVGNNENQAPRSPLVIPSEPVTEQRRASA